MPPRGIIDTGAILALLDRRDPWHTACVEAFAALPLPLVTTSAVLTELFHFLTGPSLSTHQYVLNFLIAQRNRVFTSADKTHNARCTFNNIP